MKSKVAFTGIACFDSNRAWREAVDGESDVFCQTLDELLP
jgi:hypothetical protein